MTGLLTLSNLRGTMARTRRVERDASACPAAPPAATAETFAVISVGAAAARPAPVPLDIPNQPLMSERSWKRLGLGIVAGAAVTGAALGGAGGALLGVGAVALLGAAGLAAVATRIVACGRRDDARSADCIIVLGSSARPDGTAGEVLSGRVRHAEALYRQGRAPAIILTGGRGAVGHAESDAARRLALADGIPPTALLQETSSVNTFENFTEARDIMARHGWTSCIISTDPFHARRSLDLAHDVGLQAVASPVPDSTTTAPRHLWRECVSTLRYWNYRLGRHWKHA